ADLPIRLKVGGQSWSPRNYEERYEGSVSVRHALEHSLNAATVRIAQTVGLPSIVEMARTLGLRGHLTSVPAMALGAFEVVPLDLARAYVTLANGGVRLPAVSGIRAVQFGDGEVQPRGAGEAVEAVAAAEA